MGELDFEALWLNDALGSRDAVLWLIVASMILIVPVAKETFGDWSTAWTFEGSVAALLTVWLMFVRGNAS